MNENSKLYALIEDEFRRYDADTDLIQRIAKYGTHGLKSWVVKNNVKRAKGAQLQDSVSAITGWLDGEMSETQVFRAYFSAPYLPKSGIKKRYEYAFVRSFIEKTFPYTKLWDSILPYVYRNVRNVVIELLAERDIRPVEIAIKTNVSNVTVYNIRKGIIAQRIKEEGEIKL